MNELQAYSAKEIRAQVNLIQEVMQAVMKDGTHYGKIPGCDKPTLLKPGSEKILSTFGIAVKPIVEDLSTFDKVHYRVSTEGYRNGVLVGTGIGECSSDEEKYKWRKVACDQEWEATPEDRKRIKWTKPYNKEAYSTKQIRTETADVSNTILKMAKKRSQIDLTLTATAASDIFTQDIEDMPEEYRETAVETPAKEPVKAPQRKQAEPVETEEIPPCPKCGNPLAKTADRAAQVIEYCNKKKGGDVSCEACQKV